MNRFLQSVIALSGLFITGLLGWLTIDTQNRAAESERAQAQLAFLQMYTSLTTAAIKDCDATLLPFVQNAIDILPARTDEERRERLKYDLYYQRTLNAVEACTLQKLAEHSDQGEGRTGGAAPGVTRVVQNVALQASESIPITDNWPRTGSREQAASAYRDAVQDAVSEGAWHAVLGSYVVGREESYAVADVQKLRQALPEAGDPALSIDVYRTKSATYYAVVLSSPSKDRETANRLVATAQRLNWAGDAFATLDREWTRCAQPDTVEGLKACGSASGRRD